MANVRVKNLGEEILISQGNVTVSIHDKEDVSVSIENYLVTIKDGEDVILSEKTECFVEPKEKSPVDLILLLNDILNTNTIVNDGL